jgi:hypothetical protein
MKGTRIPLFLSPLLWFVPPLVPVHGNLGLEMLNGFYKGMLRPSPRGHPPPVKKRTLQNPGTDQPVHAMQKAHLGTGKSVPRIFRRCLLIC